MVGTRACLVQLAAGFGCFAFSVQACRLFSGQEDSRQLHLLCSCTAAVQFWPPLPKSTTLICACSLPLTSAQQLWQGRAAIMVDRGTVARSAVGLVRWAKQGAGLYCSPWQELAQTSIGTRVHCALSAIHANASRSCAKPVVSLMPVHLSTGQT